MTDSHGREGTSKVLGGVHEQVQLVGVVLPAHCLSGCLSRLCNSTRAVTQKEGDHTS